MPTALYRRYRPESFADVIGQEHVTEPLMQALRTGRVSHAYLFSGPRGCGKTTSARILARCLNCEQGPTDTPCGVCDSCVGLARGGAGTVDVIEIDAASHGGVDDARELREKASFGPAASRFKVYIIDEAHMVTAAGFNALLKVVEEPPPHVKFVFATTEPEKVIGTIRSRTHHYPFRLVPPARLQDYLAELARAEGVSVAKGVLPLVVRAGAGSVRDSLSVLDQLIAGSDEDGITYERAVGLLGYTDAALLDSVVEAFAAGDAATVFTVVDRVIESGHEPRRFVEDLLERLRDLVVISAVPDGAAAILRGVPEDQLDRMRQQATHFGAAALSRAADVVNTGLTELTGTTSPRLQLELLCARVLLPGADGEQGYGARLDRIERRLAVGVPVPLAQSSGPAPSPGSAGETAVAAVPDGALGADIRPDGAFGAEAIPDETPGAEAGPDETPGAEVRPDGAFGAEAIRTAWPEVIGTLFGMKKATWSLVKEHARVLDFDGRRLVLGISSPGLTNTFRAGAHGEFVRQALIDVLGVDAQVEAVHGDVLPTRPPAARPPAARSAAPPAQSPQQHRPEHRPEQSAAQQAPAQRPVEPPGWEDVPPPVDEPGEPEPVPAPAPARGHERGTRPASGAPSASPDERVVAHAPAPSASPDERAVSHAPAPSAPVDERAVAQAPAPVPARRLHVVAPADDEASADDADAEDSGLVGRPVVERLLGGRVIDEKPR